MKSVVVRKTLLTTLALGEFINIDIFRKGAYSITVKLVSSHSKYKTWTSLSSEHASKTLLDMKQKSTSKYISKPQLIAFYDQVCQINDTITFQTIIEYNVKEADTVDILEGLKLYAKSRKIYFKFTDYGAKVRYTSVRFDGINFSHLDVTVMSLALEIGHKVIENELQESTPHSSSNTSLFSSNKKLWTDVFLGTALGKVFLGTNRVEIEASKSESGNSTPSSKQAYSPSTANKLTGNLLPLLINAQMRFFKSIDHAALYQAKFAQTCPSFMRTIVQTFVTKTTNAVVGPLEFNAAIDDLTVAIYDLTLNPTESFSLAQLFAALLDMANVMYGLQLKAKVICAKEQRNELRNDFATFLYEQFTNEYFKRNKTCCDNMLNSESFDSQLYSIDHNFSPKIIKANGFDAPCGSKSSSSYLLIVYVHGFMGSSFDLKNWKNQIRYFNILNQSGRKIFHLSSTTNEALTNKLHIEKLGENLAEEILSFVSGHREISRISFVCHSLGGLIARSSLSLLQIELPNLEYESFFTLSTPHLGICMSSNTLFDSGISMIRAWTECPVLDQLSMTDSPPALANLPILSKFKKVILVGSKKDGYCPIESATLCYKSTNSDLISRTILNIQNSLSAGIMSNSELSSFDLVEVEFENMSASTFWSLSGVFDTIVGRAAHIGMVDDHKLSELLILLFDSDLLWQYI